ncbi:terminase large subunit domain-containing protein [Arsenicibacter rosenii]|uniref:Uncharacterized protein n=1 Tax=Arsenicibacter rosenii TaxID=1750698 RepID=A0A1S2VQX9_9BACT|nr:terminase family protein [Arsenicibacter rosenii]OIN61172.1 hypothetical protein BLX24_03685 [Arsenicibacter rosenii]
MSKRMAQRDDTRYIYANDKQTKFLRSRAKRKTFMGGRGSGKTRTLAIDTYENFFELPKGKVVLAGNSYVQLDSVVLPGLKAGLKACGFDEYTKHTPWGVYVVGIQPPDHWERPWEPVGKRAIPYTMSFINGLSYQFVSEDNAQTHRGINSDAVRADESAQIKESFIGEVLLPTMRANRYRAISKSRKWKSFYDFTSAPWTDQGKWILKTEEAYLKMMALRAEMATAEKEKIPPTHLWLESTYLDNADVLPDDYAETLRDVLTDLQFDVEVLNKRIDKLPNCFYFALSENIHYYTQCYDYQWDDKLKLHVYRSNDYLSDKDLEISLDFNADICWCVTGQEVGSEFRVIRSMFEKSTLTDTDKNLIKALAEKWCETYASHERKVVHVWGDLSGKNRSAGNDQENRPFFETYCKVLESKGWRIVRRYQEPGSRKNPGHKDKYTLISLLMEQSNPRTPRVRFNRHYNKELLIAMKSTPVKTDGSFKKDKSSEKQARNREYATDGTDALDYLLWGKYRNLIGNRGPLQNHIASM